MNSSCRFCKQQLNHVFCDLGITPLSNAYLKEAQLLQQEPKYPLKALICQKCLLVQLEEFQTPKQIFSDYAYFSSFSSSWLAHCKKYAEDMKKRFCFGSNHQIIEIASNDGYLLQFFKEQDIPVLGIEPAANVAIAAKEKGIETIVEFFGQNCAFKLKSAGKQADLLLGNNVLAHVPDLNDFILGMKILLKPDGVITMEFPHLHCLMESNQFDTIYHEHFSYFSFLTVDQVFDFHGLDLFDVERLPTHGGSLRIYAKHKTCQNHQVSSRVQELKEFEKEKGYDLLSTYLSFNSHVEKVKQTLTEFLKNAKQKGHKVVGYGAPAKGNTLLNYCGITKQEVSYTVDLNPNKQGKYLPGTKIPIFDPKKIHETRPDFLLILPWNLKEEIMRQMEGIKQWGGRFVIPIPELSIV